MMVLDNQKRNPYGTSLANMVTTIGKHTVTRFAAAYRRQTVRLQADEALAKIEMSL